MINLSQINHVFYISIQSPIRILWCKINEVFKYLTNLEQAPELIEIELIAHLLKDKLRLFYKDNRDIPALLLGFEILWNIKQKENEIEVHLNNFALSLPGSAIDHLMQQYINRIRHLEESLSKAHDEISILKKENIELKKMRAKNVDRSKQVYQDVNECEAQSPIDKESSESSIKVDLREKVDSISQSKNMNTGNLHAVMQGRLQTESIFEIQTSEEEEHIPTNSHSKRFQVFNMKSLMGKK